MKPGIRHLQIPESRKHEVPGVSMTLSKWVNDQSLFWVMTRFLGSCRLQTLRRLRPSGLCQSANFFGPFGVDSPPWAKPHDRDCRARVAIARGSRGSRRGVGSPDAGGGGLSEGDLLRAAGRIFSRFPWFPGCVNLEPP